MTVFYQSKSGKVKCDPTALKILRERLRSLDDRGGRTNMRRLWFGEKDTSRNWDELIMLKETLKVLSSSLADAIRLAKSSYLGEGCGILQLPDEILANIFERAVTDEVPTEEKLHEAFAISHVCKQFRSVALNVPKLWDDVSDEWAPELVKLLFARCNRPIIRVHFDVVMALLKTDRSEEKKPLRVNPSLTELLESMPVNSIVHGLSIDYKYHRDGDDAIAALSKLYNSGHLIHLSHLDISYSGLKFSDRSLGGLSGHGSDLETLAALEFPMLKSFKCGTVFPNDINAPQLVECEISLYSLSRIKWDVSALLGFLSSIPTIRFLTLEFCCADRWEGEKCFMVELSNVEDLSITIHQGTRHEIIEELMAFLVLRNVIRMLIEAHLNHNDSMEACLHSIFARQSDTLEDTRLSFQKLEKLDLRIFDEGYHDVFPTEIAYPRMPSLRHLSIEAPGMRCPTNWSMMADDLKELRVLRLKNCHYLEHQHSGDPLTDAIEHLNNFKRLERIEFHDCPDLMRWKADIEEVFPKEKLHWSTSPEWSCTARS